MSSDFIYREFFHQRPGTDRRGTRWERLSIEEIASRIESTGGIDCFATIQSWASKVPEDDEAHYAPPYADFDAPDLDTAQRDVALLVQYARDELDLADDDIQVFFSGRKGFHVVFNPNAFGVAPSPDLTYVYKRMFAHLTEYLGLTSLDSVVYSKKRQLRLVNTRHSGTGLFKVWLDADEMTLSTDDICGLAAGPRVVPPAWPDVRSDLASDLLRRFSREYDAEVEARRSAPVELRFSDTEGDPVCVQDIVTGGIKKDGDRNKATMVLGSYFKDRGASVDAAIATLEPWALKLKWRHPDDRHVIANTISTTKAVYDNNDYHFGCAFIRSLHGDKANPEYERVACAGSMCPFVHKIVTEEVAEIHLSKIGDPALVQGEAPVKTRICVAGRTESPFILPRKITVQAVNDECDRPSCELHAVGGRMSLDLYERDLRMLISMVNNTDQHRMTVIKAHITKRSCKAFFEPEITERIRVVEFMAIPMAASRHEDVPELEGAYTYQTCYAIGTEIDLTANAYYEVTGRVVEHPRTQGACLAITDAEPLQDVIETFDLEHARPHLDVYAGIEEPLRAAAILADVTVNTTRVFGRDMALLALLMTMHSPLYLRWDGERYGGWMQALVVGDTGEGKSQMIERLMRAIGLGELMSAQSASRTGLLYSINEIGSRGGRILQWGALVLNDRRMLVVDEASGIERDEWAQMRNARRDGVFKVARAVVGEAPTRTRLIMLSNPRHGNTMSMQSAHGVEAVESLFEAADIRRFDLVIGFRHGSVTPDTIDEGLITEIEKRFTPDVLRANVLWAWSRTADDIYWVNGAKEAVKGAARRLNAKYDNLGKITLLGADAEEKIARMSQAFAAMLHSSDSKHIICYVKPEHVLAVEKLVEYTYSSADLEFDMYARTQGKSGDIDYEATLAEIEKQITAPIFTSAMTVDFDEVMDFFFTNQYIDNRSLEAILDDLHAAKRVLKVLLKHRLLRRTRSGTMKSPHFNEVLRIWNRRRTFD